MVATLKFFGICLIAALGFLLTVTAFAQEPPMETVRPAIGAYADGTRGPVCSAVVVAPSEAWTAGHCLAHVDSVFGSNGAEYKILGGKILDTDGAILYVPGLPCPCAKPDAKAPEVGSEIVVIGYPLGEGPEKTIGRVAAIETTAAAEMRIFGETDAELVNEVFGPRLYIYSDAATMSGYSGGGSFQLRDGEWKLVGIHSHGIKLFDWPEPISLQSGDVPVAEFRP